MKYQQAQWRRLITLVLPLSFITFITMASGDIAFEKFTKYLKIKGITPGESLANLNVLEQIFSQLIYEIKAGQKVEEPEEVLLASKRQKCQRRTLLPLEVCALFFKDHRSDLIAEKEQEEALPFLEQGLEKLRTARSLYFTDGERSSYLLMLAQNILYGFFAQSYKGRAFTAKEILTFNDKTWTYLPYLTNKQRHKKLRPYEADKEARYLVNPKSPSGKMLDRSGYVDLSHAEIAALDVSEDHHLWFSNKTLAKMHNPADLFLKQKLNEMVRKVPLQVSQDLGHLNFQESQNILLLKNFNKGYGAHPKIKVTDLYGFTWKLKWGNEFYSEAFANLLYLDLGGKHQDVNFSRTYQNPVLVIFPNEGEIVSFADLAQKYTEYGYKGSLKAFTHPDLPFGAIDKTTVPRLAELIGLKSPQLIDKLVSCQNHQFAVFLQASLELQDHRITKRSGPIAQSMLGSEDDRVLRGLHLFSLFIDNFDGKDENTETIINEDEQYLQTINDLGGAFSGFKLTGKGLNRFDEVKFLSRNFFPTATLIYRRTVLYRSLANEKATFADLYWMASKITALSDARIYELALRTKMPDFFVDLLAYKIVARRNRLSKVFDIPGTVISPPKLENRCFDLSSIEKIHSTAKSYNLPGELLVQAVQKDWPTLKDAADCPLYERAINKKSKIVALLQARFFPSGLD